MPGRVTRTASSAVSLCPNAALAFVALAALVFISVLESKGALLFLGAGLLIAALHPLRGAGALVKHGYALVLPAWCLASTLWSVYPGISFRFGLQFAVTAAIAVFIATSVSPRSFLRILFTAFGIGMLASIAAGNVRDDTGAWLGIFGSKNAFAGAVSTFLVLSAALALDRTASRTLRLVALAGLPVGILFLLRAQSAGAIVLTLPVLAVMPLTLAFRRLAATQRLILTAFLILAGGLLAVTAFGYRHEMAALFLEATGKDPTLTGRTDLWWTAWAFISERPLLGLGYQAFWVRGFGPAEALWAEFGITARAGFNFHNTYISNAVEIGMIGTGIQAAMLCAALGLSLVWTLRSGRAEALAAFALSLLTLLTTFVEVPVFFQFSIRSVVSVAVLVYAVRAAAHYRSARRDDPLRPAFAPPPLLLRP